MQIGPSFNLPSLPSRSGAQAPFNPSKADQQADTQPQVESYPQIDVTELIQAAEQGAQDRTRFFNMDRELPLRGQEALSVYLTNAQFSLQSESAQLMGVDLYI